MTADQYVAASKKLIVLLRTEKGNYAQSAIDKTLSLYKNRIFLNSTDSDGVLMAPYGNYIVKRGNSYNLPPGLPWVEARSNKGLQTERVDLKFSGELRDSLKADQISGARGKNGAITTDRRGFDIVVRQENFRNQDIFGMSEQEIDKVVEYIEEEIYNLIINSTP